MRSTFLILSLFPSTLVAETFSFESDVTAVTLYPQGASIVREVPYSMPAGAHDLVLTGLPEGLDLSAVRVDLTGATLGAVTGRRDFVPPVAVGKSEAIEAAKAKLAALEARLRVDQGEIIDIQVEAEAAQSRADFLKTLKDGPTTQGMDAEGLRAMALMIGEDIRIARTEALEAKRRAEERQLEQTDLRTEIELARQALAALETEEEGGVQLSISASADAAAEGVIRVSYPTFNAAWMPSYDMRLSKSDGQLVIERGAIIAQNTGEDWNDVTLTLSTVRPSEQIMPREVYAWQRVVVDKSVLQPRARKQLEMSSVSELGDARGVEAEAPVVAEAAPAAPSYDGLAVSYAYPTPVSIANRADQVQIKLGSVETEASVGAWAVPLYDQTGFLMASFTNDSGELILPTPHLNLYLDGRFMGRSSLPEVIPAGGEADVSFGAIDGLRLTRTVTRNEGDRGMISRSTELSEAVEMKVENLTGETWPVTVFDRVPYSEQEELEISWQARPRPSTEDYDDRQGVMAWELELAPGASGTIGLNYELEWPEGKVLR